MTTGILPAALVILLFVPFGRSQTSTGAVNGSVLDSSSAAVPGAAVTIRNTATGEARAAKTDERGAYVFPSLLPGTYELTAEAAGFKKTVRGNIIVDVQQAVRVDPVLQVGNVLEVIEVKVDIPLLQPSTSSLGQVVDNQKILDLPLQGRNAIELVTLTAGVVPLEGFGGLAALGNAYAQGNVSIGGGPGLTSAVLFDGADVNGALVTAPAFVPSVDTIGEFKVQTNAFSAEFGRTGGGVINVAMRSGTNRLHGGIYEFLRNRVFEANTFFNNTVGAPKPQFTYNLFGGTLGGPVTLPGLYDGKDRSFFFAAYEGFRERRGLSPLMSVPTVLQHGGDFPQTLNQAGQLIRIYDPLTVSQLANGRYTRQPFPDNRVPRERFDPVAAKVIDYYPMPNLPGDPTTGTQNFIANEPVGNISDQINARIDHNLRSWHRLFGRYSLSRANRGAAMLFGPDNLFGGSNPGGGNALLLSKGEQFVLRDTVTASPTLLLDFSYAIVRQFISRVPLSWGRPLTDLGFSRAFSDASPRYYPNFTITNYSALTASGQDLIRRGDYTHSLQGAITRVAGRSTLKTGAEYRLKRANDYQPPVADIFNFSPAWSQQDPLAGAANAGSALASFLLGYCASGTAATGAAMALQNHYVAGYIQDDIRVTRRLTLNLGARYDLETPRTDRYNQLNWFDFYAPSPLAQATGLANLHGGFVFAGVNGNPRRQQIVDTNNFSPRFGFAYSVDSKTVVRSGYGIFYMAAGGTGPGGNVGNLGFSASTAMGTSDDSGLTAAAVLSDPFPKGVNQPSGSAGGMATMVGQAIWLGVDRGNHAGYVQQYNLNIQRTLPGNTLIDLAYAGSHSIGVPVRREVNQLDPANYKLGGVLLQTVPNPFYGIVRAGSLSAATTSVGQLLRPYPQFLDSSLWQFEGNNNYNSFQAKLERRMASGLGFLVAYTAAKSIGDSNPIGDFLGVPSASFQNNYHRRAERSLLTQDVSQRMVITYSYRLPVGRGLKVGQHWRRSLDILAGGWQVNGITALQTGAPLKITLNASNPYGGIRPNSTGQTANLPASERSRVRWFNTSVFTQPPAYSLGNVGRTLPDARNPGIQNFDLSLFKIISLTEALKLQFRAEAFNVLNHTQFNGPNAAFGSTMFGVISLAKSPRTVQLALKLNF
jgi:hypothetical protein